MKYDLFTIESKAYSKESILRILKDHNVPIDRYIRDQNIASLLQIDSEDVDNFYGIGVHSSFSKLTEEETLLEKEMYRALDNNEFELYYQPVINLSKNKLHGFEALIRWNDPQKGLVSPGTFIPIAEKSPIIIALGFWIVDQAAKQIKKWIDDGIDFIPQVNVNLSATQFLYPDLPDEIIAIINKYSIPNDSIAFELTESSFMADNKAANISLLTLRSQGYKIYLDDFGTGYSSLSYLLHFPVDIIKIDMSFVEWMHIDEQSEQIVKSVITMAHNMKMKVVAEGVSEEDHISMLKQWNCDYVQGYYYSKPLPQKAATEYIIEWS